MGLSKKLQICQLRKQLSPLALALRLMHLSTCQCIYLRHSALINALSMLFKQMCDMYLLAMCLYIIHSANEYTLLYASETC